MNNLFGNPNLDAAKRNLNDFFIIKPFSVMNTMDGTWLRRKAWWNNLITDQGKSRESTLFKKTEDATMIGKLIQDVNDGVSLFDPVLCECLVRWFSETGMVVIDPFAGDVTRGYVSCKLGRKYVGVELREEQVLLNRARMQEAELAGYKYICDGSQRMDKHIPANMGDMILTCPPYAFLEKYSDDPEDLSNMSVEDFFAMYKVILGKTYSVLKDDRFAAIVVSEVRDKDGSFIGLVPKTIEYMEMAGYKYYNEIILMNSVNTLRFRVGKAMNSGRKVGRMHQNILVFYKGDISKIKTNFSDLITKDDE